MITTVKPMSFEHTRALHLAYELQERIGGLMADLLGRGKFRPGCPVGMAWDRIDEVVRFLEPAEEPAEGREDRPATPRLRLVAGKDVQP